MERIKVITLLEKYWRAESTVEEEKALADWFNAQPPGSLDPDLEPYAALFSYFDEEARVHPSPDFEARILHGIDTAGPLVATDGQAARVALIRPFRSGLISAAAVVLIIIAGLYLITPKPTAQPPATAKVTDTYDDPEKALASVRHALLIASAHLNEGRKQITNK
jgi:hypothetical protein